MCSSDLFVRRLDERLEQLYAIVNARYESERSMLITTNLERAPLAEQIGERTVSRLEEMCDMVPFYGRDRRRFEVVDRRQQPSDAPAPPAADLPRT